MTDFVEAEDMKELRSIHQDLLNLGEGLTSANIDFIDNLCEWEGNFTVDQAVYLHSLGEDHL